MLLSFALLQVVKRTSRQVSQLRNGLAETGIWPLLVERRDLIPILFPRESEAQLTAQVQQQGRILREGKLHDIIKNLLCLIDFSYLRFTLGFILLL